MSDCEHGNMTAHGNDCPWCKNAELEAENAKLLECGASLGAEVYRLLGEVGKLEATIAELEAHAKRCEDAFNHQFAIRREHEDTVVTLRAENAKLTQLMGANTDE